MLFHYVARRAELERGAGNASLLVADDLVWFLFCLLQVATLRRIVSPLAPATGGALATAAAIVWTAAWIAWAFVHLPLLLKARADDGRG